MPPAMEPRLLRHAGRAVVFRNYDDMAARMLAEARVEADHVAMATDAALAADGDLLWFDGQTWIPFGQPAPEGTSWVRVALDHDSSAAGDPGAPPRGWAVPGTPTWRGYIDGADPWVLDEKGWRELEADYRGYDLLFRPSEALPGAQPFLDVASFSGGPIAVCRSVIQSEEPGSALTSLGRALSVFLEHDLARLPGVVVLEREHLRLLRQEQQLTGVELELRCR